MRIWFDTEFIEDGEFIHLLSIGAVREDGKTFYRELKSDSFRYKADPWVIVNVLDHLETKEDDERATRKEVADDFLEFAGENPEFWAYYADYDWVALCQLYGRMIDLPKGWPMYCRDVKQLADFTDVNVSSIPYPEGLVEHHALSDAHWCRMAWEALND